MKADGIAVADDVVITDQGYANGFSLVFATADGLQCLVDAADAWCGAVGMQASPVETHMMEMIGPDFATGSLDMVSNGGRGSPAFAGCAAG